MSLDIFCSIISLWEKFDESMNVQIEVLFLLPNFAQEKKLKVIKKMLNENTKNLFTCLPPKNLYNIGMLSLILHDSDALFFANLQKEIAKKLNTHILSKNFPQTNSQNANSQNSVFIPLYPLWITFSIPYNSCYKESIKNVEIQKLTLENEHLFCPVNLSTKENVFRGKLTLGKFFPNPHNATSHAKTEYMASFKKIFNLLEKHFTQNTFPKNIKIFRIARANFSSSNTWCVTESTWVKLR
ncbi:MAG: hypothetical protein IKI31_03645 [Treponema sp.]|nr:hypothetical protein [Treponema sp.]